MMPASDTTGLHRDVKVWTSTMHSYAVLNPDLLCCPELETDRLWPRWSLLMEGHMLLAPLPVTL